MKNLYKTRLIPIRQHKVIVFLCTLFIPIWTSAALGQRGAGDGNGVAQQMPKPRLVCISGKLQEIKTHPCENTTGKADLGTHLILKDKQGRELNVHLGPAPALSETVKRLKVGRKIYLFGFRTDKMAPNQYVAQTLILGSHIVHLRDSDLRPYWAGSRFGQETLSPSDKTTVDQRTTIRRSCYYCCPKLWQRHYFQNEQQPRWRRRCRGRACCHRWEWDIR